MPPLTPGERSLRAKIAANVSWSQTSDRSARTANARKAMLDKFEQQVDPEGKLPPSERAKRAANARRAHYQQLAFRSARSRRRQAGDREVAAPPSGGSAA